MPAQLQTRRAVGVHQTIVLTVVVLIHHLGRNAMDVFPKLVVLKNAIGIF